MSWDEVEEVLKIEELKPLKSERGTKVATAPFFIAGVPGRITVTFKKSFLGPTALKAIRYEADVKDADIRREAYSSVIADLKPYFGDPSSTEGMPEDENSEGNNKTAAQPYSAVWKHPDGDIVLEMNPKAERFILRAEANTANKKLAWLK